MDTVELIIDEQMPENGINAISLVEFPAIEENFVALSKHKVEFKFLTHGEKKKLDQRIEKILKYLIFLKKTLFWPLQ